MHNFFRYHCGLEWEKRKIVGKMHAKRILQTAPHSMTPKRVTSGRVHLHDLMSGPHISEETCSAATVIDKCAI